MRRHLKFLLPILWMGVIFYLSSVPNLQLTGEYSVYDAALRKVAHMIEFGVLYLLWYWGFNQKTSVETRCNASLQAGIIAILYAVSDEIHQSFVPTRSTELLDLLLDSVGVGLAILIGRIRASYPHRRTNV